MGRKGLKSFFISLAMRLVYLDISGLFYYYFGRIIIILIYGFLHEKTNF